MGDREKKTALFEQFARVSKALANGKRLELIDLLAQGERSVESLTAAAGLRLSTASAHLQALKQAGLVTTRKEGARIYNDLAGTDVAQLYSLVRSVARARVRDVEQKRVEYLGTFGTDDTGPTGEPLEMTREELLERATAGTITVLDVRPTEEYRAAHIPGAVSIPLEELSSRIGELPAGEEIVAYCRGAYCVLAYEAVDLLHSTGRRARRLNDGMLEWRLDGLPVDAGHAA
jgi:rhodanese-related sulfurtransferase/DNA-binding transcriptional ArsR family regulator